MKYSLLSLFFLLTLLSCSSNQTRTVSENPQHKYLSLPIEHLYGDTYFVSLESDVPKSYWNGSPVRIFSNQLGECGEIVAKKELGVTDNAPLVKLKKDGNDIVLCYVKDKKLEVREFTKGFQLSNQYQIEVHKNSFYPIILSKQDVLIPYSVAKQKTDFRALNSIHGRKYSNGHLVWDKKLLDAKNDNDSFNTLTELYSIDNHSFVFEGHVATGENNALAYQKNTFLITYDKEGNPIWQFETNSSINLASKVHFDQHHFFTIINNDTLDYPTLLKIDKETGTINTSILKEINYTQTKHVDNFQIVKLGESFVIFGRKNIRPFVKEGIEDTIFAIQLSNTIPPKTEKYSEYLTKDKSKRLQSIKIQKLGKNELLISSDLLSTKQTGENIYSSEKTGEWLLHINQNLEVLQDTVMKDKNENTFVKLKDENIYILSQYSNDPYNNNYIYSGFSTQTYNDIKAEKWSTHIEINKVIFDE